MAQYKVIANGEKMGVFEAETAEGAIEAYAKDAGYKSYAALCEVTGDDPEDDDVVAREITDEARCFFINVNNPVLPEDMEELDVDTAIVDLFCRPSELQGEIDKHLNRLSEMGVESADILVSDYLDNPRGDIVRDFEWERDAA